MDPSKAKTALDPKTAETVSAHGFASTILSDLDPGRGQHVGGSRSSSPARSATAKLRQLVPHAR